MKEDCRLDKGFSLVEALLSVAVLLFLSGGLAFALIYVKDNPQLAGDRLRANFLALEGMEILDNLSADDFNNLTVGTYGFRLSGNQWVLASTSDQTEKFNRSVIISNLDTNRKSAIVNVSWQQITQRPTQVSLEKIFTYWRRAVNNKKGGLLVYGNGTTTNDSILYKVLDANTQLWSTPLATADIDAGSTNRALRAVKVYASASRNEKIMLSRHFNGTTQYIYAQVYNGDTQTWGNVQLLSSWNATTFLDVQNFDGDYLANGDFLVVYSDNTATPKSRVWNATSSAWSITPVNLNSVVNAPTYIIAKTRPGTNEVMSAFFTQGRRSYTQFFNGGAYTTANWVLVSHANGAPNNTNRFIDFVWSPFNPLIGALVYSNNNSDRSVDIRLFTANGSGGGAWANAFSTNNQGTGGTRLKTIDVSARPNAGEFLACNSNTVPEILCYQFNFNNTLNTPTNQLISSLTDTGIQKSFDFSYQNISGNGLIGYSDNSNTGKLKKYYASSNTFDLLPNSFNTSISSLKTIRSIPEPTSDDIMFLLADASQNMYSVVFDGINNIFYTTPIGLSWTLNGSSGSNSLDYWHDFVWDLF